MSDMKEPNIAKKVAAFFSKYPLKHAKKGSVIINAHEKLESIHYLENGLVQKYDVTESGSVVVVNIFKPGSFFPMSWALANIENVYFYEVVSQECVYRSAPKEDVVNLLQNNSDVVEDLLSRLYVGVEGMQRRMAHLMGGSTESRLVYELVVESSRFGHKTLNGECELSITEEELAQRSGLSRETVSRHLGTFKKQGILSISHGLLTIHDGDSLRKQLGEKL